MKLYLLTIVRSDGYDDGKESDTNIYASMDMLIDKSFEDYEKTWESLFDNNEVEEENGVMVDDEGNERLLKESYAAELELNGYVLIQLSDYHIQFELSEQELGKPEMSTSELLPLVMEVEKLQEESLSINGDIVDADTILVDYIDACDYEFTGFSKDVINIWKNSADKESIERLFYEFTDVEFKDYLEKCIQNISRVTA